MITLYGMGPGFGLPEISPYVTKTEVQLRMADLDYRREPGARETSPKGQLPWIDDDGERIADSHFIRLHVERKYGVDFDAGLTAAERAQAWAIERMLENHFGWTTAGIRWLDPENFAKGPAAFFSQIPEPARAQVCAEVQAAIAERISAVGLGRHTPAEVFGLGLRSLQALSALIGAKPYLMGDRPCGTDATAFAMLAGLMAPIFEAPLKDAALQMPNLVAYVERMMGEFYPGFPWVEGEVLAA